MPTMRLSDPLPVADHLDALRRYGLSLTRNPDEADDLVHDALVKAFDKRHTFRAGGDLRRWLLAIVHNTFINGVRQRRSADRRAERAAQLVPDRQEPPQEHAVEVARVRAGFDRLPAEQRAVLHLVVGEGLSYQDAAQVLNLPLGTLMSRLARARAALRPPEMRRQDQDETPATRGRLRVVGGTDER